MSILACFERLNDKATQRQAAEELARLVQVRARASGRHEGAPSGSESSRTTSYAGAGC